MISIFLLNHAFDIFDVMSNFQNYFCDIYMITMKNMIVHQKYAEFSLAAIFPE